MAVHDGTKIAQVSNCSMLLLFNGVIIAMAMYAQLPVMLLLVHTALAEAMDYAIVSLLFVSCYMSNLSFIASPTHCQ